MKTKSDDPVRSTEFERFEALAKKVVAVPKKDVQERESKEKAAKGEARKQRP